MRQNEKAVLHFGANGKVISESIGFKTAYISGKITGLPDLNVPKFEAAEKLLRSYGYKVINPHTICNDIPKHAEWHEYMKRCVHHLPLADVVFLLPDWQDSTGARLESVIAHQLGMAVYEIESFEFKSEEQNSKL